MPEANKIFYLQQAHPIRGEERVFNWPRKFPGQTPADSRQQDFVLDVSAVLVLLKKVVEEKTASRGI